MIMHSLSARLTTVSVMQMKRTRVLRRQLIGESSEELELHNLFESRGLLPWRELTMDGGITNDLNLSNPVMMT